MNVDLSMDRFSFLVEKVIISSRLNIPQASRNEIVPDEDVVEGLVIQGFPVLELVVAGDWS